ncbi:MAG TPA: rhomboid-like protein [Trebonia sp.]
MPYAQRYAIAWSYLACFAAAQGVYLLLGPAARASFLGLASTSVANLQHDPVGCLVVSAFVSGDSLGGTLTWLALIAVAMCGAVRAVGGRRTAAVCAAGHVIGTLASEGIVACRVASGALPDSYRHLIDVGPSYVVVSALALALLLAPWRWRLAAAVAMVVLIFPGQIFAGLTSLDVAAVGHVTAITTALLATLIPAVRRARSARDRQPAAMPPTASPMR